MALTVFHDAVFSLKYKKPPPGGVLSLSASVWFILKGWCWLKRSEMIKFVQSLSAGEASQTLRVLLDENPDLMKKTYDCAVKVTSTVDAEDIANDVLSSLDDLDYDDLNGRAGRTRHGYIEPDQAAWDLFEEALNPFIDEIVKNQKRALPAVAKAYCIGIIKGLQMYEKGSCSELSDWLQDAPGEYIDTVVDEWKKGSPSSEDIADVMRFVKGYQS